MTVGMHLCRGNLRSRWLAAGSYEAVAERLFNETRVDAFFLEYDTPRAGDFQPLRFVPRGKGVVLGLISSKTPVLEDKAALARRERIRDDRPAVAIGVHEVVASQRSEGFAWIEPELERGGAGRLPARRSSRGEPLQDPAVELAFWLRETAQTPAASPLRPDHSHLERCSDSGIWN